MGPKMHLYLLTPWEMDDDMLEEQESDSRMHLVWSASRVCNIWRSIDGSIPPQICSKFFTRENFKAARKYEILYRQRECFNVCASILSTCAQRTASFRSAVRVRIAVSAVSDRSAEEG